MRFAEIITDTQPRAFWNQLLQVGVQDAVVTLPRGFIDWRQTQSDHPWSHSALAQHQETLREHGLEIAVIEDNPPMDALHYGRPGREEELEQVLMLIRAMGRLGIRTWCYGWLPSLSWVRNRLALKGRGGALVTGYEHALIDHSELTLQGAIDAAAVRDNLIWFLERVIPVAEDVGVRLALHPDDPPVDEIRGIARIMHNRESYEWLFERIPSPANAMTFCQGNLTLTTGDLPGLIRDFGQEQRIAFVHFRDVDGVPENYVETFHDNGMTNMLECMRAYHEVGYDGVMRSDHTPLLAGDAHTVPGYSDLGRLFAIGYMTGLREAARASLPATDAAFTANADH